MKYTPAASRGWPLAMQIAGLAGTGWVVWRFSVAPRLLTESLASIAWYALSRAIAACIWSAVISLILERSIARALRISRTAVWFAPAVILISQGSPLAFGPALALVFSATRFIFGEWLELSGEPTPGYRARFAAAFITALALQFALVAVEWRQPLTAAALGCLTTALLVVLTFVVGDHPHGPAKPLSRSALALVLTILLAAVITVGGIAQRGRGAGDSSAQTADESQTDLPIIDRAATGDAEITDKSFPGIVLWPEVRSTHVTLVVPPPSWIHAPVSTIPQSPYSIPFTGQYWMFKPPSSRPPQNSLVERGSPSALSFRTTDHRPMLMEAHQLLDHPLDLGCCRGIQLAILNADRYTGTVTVELILTDSRKRALSQSLGRRSVTSRPGRGFESLTPTPELVDFTIPRPTHLHEFNHIAAIFHRDLMRADRSAKISIDRFILLPRSTGTDH